MEVTVLDPNFKGRGILDVFDSLVWVDRYTGFGDVEIDTYSVMDILRFVNEGCYLTFRNSEHIMIVDAIQIKTDPEKGNKLVIKGRSLESILDRRIVWQQTVLTGNFQDGILKLLNENAINPADPSRKIDGLIFEPSTDPAITELTVDAQFTGDSLYDAITNLCVSQNVGFKIVRNEEGQFVFSLYVGMDRSYSQMENPYIVFSPKFDNILNGEYLETNRIYRTVVLVGGEGEGVDRTMVAVSLADGPMSGLDRREIFTNASGITRNTLDGTLTDEEYYAQLAQKGLEVLASNQIQTAFEGQLQPNQMYQYGHDFFMGDILQVADQYGHEGRVQITEFFHVQDSTGIKMYPTFTTVI